MTVVAVTATFVAGMMLVAPVALGATLAQARSELRTRHLQPPPLFPRRLPVIFNGSSVALIPESGFDYNVDFARGNGSHTGDFYISLRRGPASLLTSELRDPQDRQRRKLHIRGHTVYGFEVASGKYVLTWHEQGRTYLLIDKYQSPRAARATMSSLARVLAPLT